MSEIYFATNRSYNRRGPRPPEWFGEDFHPDGPYYYRVGRAQVRREGDDYRLLAIDVEPERKERKPRRDVDPTDVTAEAGIAASMTVSTVDRSGAIVGSAKLFETLRRQLLQDGRHIIGYIHGFANSFENSILRAAQLQSEYRVDGIDPIVFAFSWPSDASMTPFSAYRSDRQDAKASGIAMARAMMRLIAFLRDLDPPEREDQGGGRVQCACPMHLVAHSMGNWALRHAIAGLAEMLNTQQLPRLFDNVFLMAADEDNDALEHSYKLSLLARLAHRTHVYYASDDRALHISTETKGNSDRLGADGPRNLALADERFFAVDCSDVSSTSTTHLRHQYYRLRPEVIEDVRRVMAGQPRPHELRIGERRWRLRPE